MLHGYFNIAVIEEWITFFAALIILNRKTGIWQLFKILMLVILTAETVGWYLRTHGHMHENAIPFNVLMLLTNSFLIWFFAKTKWFEAERKILFTCIAVFSGFWIINILFFQGMWNYNYYSETLSDLMLTVICGAFFYKVLKSEDYIKLLQYEYFWLATGVLFSSLGSALLYHFSALLDQYHVNTGIDVGTYINFGLNTLLYLSLIISFICRRKATRLLQVS